MAVDVRNILAPGIAGSDQSICYGDAPDMISANAPAGGSGTFQYQWQLSINGGLSWSDVASAGNSLNYSPGPLFVTTLFKLKQTDSFCTPDQIVYTNIVTIEVPVLTSFAGPNDVVCGLVPYKLTQAATKNAITWVWSTSGTGSFTEQYDLNATYFPTTADMKSGHVVLTLTISDICGTVVSDDMTLTLSQLPVAYFAYSTPTCSNAPVYFTDQSAVSNGSINTWIWDFGDGVYDTINFPDSPNAQHTYSAPGISYNVKLSVLTKLGCKADFQQPITTLRTAVANFTTSLISCDNQPVQFTNTTQLNGSIGSQPWIWDFGDPNSGITNTSVNENPTHLFSKSGSFKVTLIVNNNNNCLDTISKEVHIKARPPVDFTFSTSCLNEPVTFSPDAIITDTNSIATWHWDFGGSAVSDKQNATHVFTSPGECHDLSMGTDRILAILPNAYLQGETAGVNMAGGEKSFDNAIPMNAIGFFGLHIITAGSYDGETWVEATEHTYKKLVSKDNLLRGFILIGDVARAGIYTSLIREQTPLDSIDYELIREKPQLMAFTIHQRAACLGAQSNDADRCGREIVSAAQRRNPRRAGCGDHDRQLLGQRYIGAGMGGKSLLIQRRAGQRPRLLPGRRKHPRDGNAQDQTGDTMNGGTILVEGSSGDATGYSMRGGKIFVRGNVGYRAGIHMKAYREHQPLIIVGGETGSFLGEYQAGGTIIVLGLNSTRKAPVGNLCCTGMHGGRMYLRCGELPKDLPTQVKRRRLRQTTWPPSAGIWMISAGLRHFKR